MSTLSSSKAASFLALIKAIAAAPNTATVEDPLETALAEILSEISDSTIASAVVPDAAPTELRITMDKVAPYNNADFSVTVAGAARTVNSAVWVLTGAKPALTLVLASAVTVGQAVVLTHAPSGDSQIRAISDLAVTNETA